jgi:hypothetical protein
MKFRNYCVVVMGETKEVFPEIVMISETTPNVLDAKGILIATFSSIAEPKELTDYFKLNGRNFFLFDLNPENSGYYIAKDEINEGLFGFLKDMDSENLKQKTDNLIQEISSTTVTNRAVKVKKSRTAKEEYTMAELDNMSPKDKNDLMNRLIDKGVDNLSEYDKELLSKLSY